MRRSGLDPSEMSSVLDDDFYLFCINSGLDPSKMSSVLDLPDCAPIEYQGLAPSKMSGLPDLIIAHASLNIGFGPFQNV